MPKLSLPLIHSNIDVFCKDLLSALTPKNPEISLNTLETAVSSILNHKDIDAYKTHFNKTVPNGEFFFKVFDYNVDKLSDLAFLYEELAHQISLAGVEWQETLGNGVYSVYCTKEVTTFPIIFQDHTLFAKKLTEKLSGLSYKHAALINILAKLMGYDSQSDYRKKSIVQKLTVKEIQDTGIETFCGAKHNPIFDNEDVVNGLLEDAAYLRGLEAAGYEIHDTSPLYAMLAGDAIKHFQFKHPAFVRYSAAKAHLLEGFTLRRDDFADFIDSNWLDLISDFPTYFQTYKILQTSANPGTMFKLNDDIKSTLEEGDIISLDMQVPINKLENEALRDWIIESIDKDSSLIIYSVERKNLIYKESDFIVNTRYQTVLGCDIKKNSNLIDQQFMIDPEMNFSLEISEIIVGEEDYEAHLLDILDNIEDGLDTSSDGLNQLSDQTLYTVIYNIENKKLDEIFNGINFFELKEKELN